MGDSSEAFHSEGLLEEFAKLVLEKSLDAEKTEPECSESGDT